jgi:hypothetical protein
MAVKKTMLVLANSVKHYPCTCVAGREITLQNNVYNVGSWIRPVSTHDEGGLAPSESQLQGGRSPTVFDFVDLTLEKHANDRLQPENWLIAPGTPWKAVTKQFEKPSYDLILESPENLWFQSSEASDRVSSTWLKRRPPTQSLYWIHVPSLTIQFGWKSWEDQYKARRRALFRYKGNTYDLGITDPLFLERHRTKFPAKGQPRQEFELRPAQGCYLCVSLAPEFNGFHYKVVATIVET